MKELHLKQIQPPGYLEFVITGEGFLIGKNRQMVNGVIDGAPAVSRRHCRVDVRGGTCCITDLGSMNGTFINNRRLNPEQPEELHDGDILKLANYEFQVLIRGDEPVPVLPEEPEDGDDVGTTVLSAIVPKMRDPRVYMVYSPIGGSGKTLCALGVASCLAAQGQKVLYINGENLPTFDYYIGDRTTASQNLWMALGRGDYDLERDILPEIGHAGYDYLKRLPRSPMAYHLDESIYINLVAQIREAGLYDTVIMDLSSEFNEKKLKWMDIADKTVIICLQDELSALKLERFMAAVGDRKSKFVYMCNRTHPELENYLNNLVSLGEVNLAEYIEESDIHELTARDVEENGYFKATAQALEEA